MRTNLLTLLLLINFVKCEYVSEGTQFLLKKGTGKNAKYEIVEREEDLEYPRLNKNIMEKNKLLWQNYYNCLEEKVKKVQKPEIRHLLEGQYTELECDFCARPFHAPNDLEWKYKPLSTEVNIVQPTILDLEPEMILTPNNNLKIFNVIEDFSGLYVCSQGRNPMSVYILEITKNDTMAEVKSTYEHNSEEIAINKLTLLIYYNWMDYTECSSCGVVGKQYRYGNCMVDVQHSGTEISSESYTTKKEPKDKSKEKDKKNSFQKLENIKKNFLKKTKTYFSGIHEDMNVTADFIKKFKNGIPCTSSYLPRAIANAIPKPEALRVVVDFCLVPCEEVQIFEVRDKFGKIIETANNSAGIYSVFQKIPPLPPDIQRRTLEADFGTDITFMCPGTLLTTAPVIWKINNKVLFPKIIANQSNGRFTIDLLNRIHIKKLRLKDSRIYSCWQRGKLAGTINLSVEKKFKVNLNHHIVLLGMVAVVGTFLFLGLKVIASQRKRKK